MDTQLKLFKGELMEELLRMYFLNLGYYVVRGIKLRYDNIDLTDVDLFLYGRTSSLSRERINVDIKNKRSPQALERIVWANGLMRILNFDSCIVATTDSRPLVHSFAQMHDTMVLDGNFLNKLKPNEADDRFSEDALLIELSKYKCYKLYPNKDWRYIYESSKSKLLTELDYSGFNSSLINLNYFIDNYITETQKRECSLRMIYIILSHALIIMDYIIKDIAFLEPKDREKKLSDGLRFGNLGKDGVDKIISMAVHISGSTSVNTFLKSLDDIPTDILKDFFSKNEITKRLFSWAKEFEYLGYNKILKQPNDIDVNLKGVISVILDFIRIDRRKFFL